jgi:seryl-tRNA(Sec) selenium transferase
MTEGDPLGSLARLLTAEAAHGCRSLAGAVVVAAAACIAGESLGAVLRLPDAGGRERRGVLLRGQVTAVDGISLLQLLRLAGAEPVEVGTAEAVQADELAAALGAGAAAGLWVGGAGDGLLGPAAFAWACRTAGVPALVVADAALPPLAALDAGADLVLVDPCRLVAAPEMGLVLGRAGLVRACRLQERGLGALFRAEPDALAAAAEAFRTAAETLAGGIAVPEPAPVTA